MHVIIATVERYGSMYKEVISFQYQQARGFIWLPSAPVLVETQL
jgi:hypothetical protein